MFKSLTVDIFTYYLNYIKSLSYKYLFAKNKTL